MEEKNQLRTPAVIQQEKNRIREWLKKLLPDGYDKVDVEAIFDSSLSYSENKEEFREKIKLLLNNLQEQAENAQNQQDKLDAEKIRDAEAEVEDYNKGIDTATSIELEGFYRPLSRAVEKICQGYSNLAFVKGRGGIGKSYNIRKKLLQHAGPEEYVEVCGEVTEAYLYRLIFENNGKIIWFKDVVKLLSGLSCLPSYTKIATNNGHKTMRKLDDTKDKVASWNFKSNKLEYKKFRKENTGLKKVVRIKTEIGVLESSPNHRWLVKTSNGKVIEKKAKDLNIKDVLLRLKEVRR